LEATVNVVASAARAVLNKYRNTRDIKSAIDRAPEDVRRSLLASLSSSEDRLKKIETRRWQMLRDNSEIQVIDFGAGTANENLSREEQDRGRLIKTTVSASARASKSEIWARFLYNLTKDQNAQNVLEMGTCVGISGAYIADALRITGGKLTTLEGDPERGRISRETFHGLGTSDRAEVIVGPFHETLTKSLNERGPFDLVFVDGHHDGEATVQYFKTLRPFVTPNALIVFDDIRWSTGMKQAWGMIASSPNLEAIDLGGIGLVRVS
jgi:predicted O-methyltransferase YrrM